MPSETLLPTGSVLTATNWASFGTGSIDEGVASHDGDGGGWRIDSSSTIVPYPKWDMTNVAVITGTITAITLKLAARTEGGTHGINMVGYINGVSVLSANFTLTASYSAQSQLFSGAWSASDLNTLQIEFQSTFGDGIRVSAFEAFISTGSGGGGSLAYAFNSPHVTAAGLVLPRRSVVIWPY